MGMMKVMLLENKLGVMKVVMKAAMMVLVRVRAKVMQWDCKWVKMKV